MVPMKIILRLYIITMWRLNTGTINKPQHWSFAYYFDLEFTVIKKPFSFDNEVVKERFGDIFFRLRCCLNYMLVRTSSLQCCIVSENNRLIEYIDNGLLMMQIISLVSYTESMCVRMLHFMCVLIDVYVRICEQHIDTETRVSLLFSFKSLFVVIVYWKSTRKVLLKTFKIEFVR